VFENQPQDTTAAVTHATPGETAVDAPSVFENIPRRSNAEAMYGRDMADSQLLCSVFESEPSASCAAATYASEAGTTAETQTVFESEPSKTSAEVRHGQVLEQAEQSAGVFESTPSLSQAAASHSNIEPYAEMARRTIGEAVDVEDCIFESIPQEVATTSSQQHSAPEMEESMVFESSPATSRADAAHVVSGGLAQMAQVEIKAAMDNAIEEEGPSDMDSETRRKSEADKAREVILAAAEQVGEGLL